MISPTYSRSSWPANADRDYIAWAAEIVQTHGNGWPRRDTTWHAHVDLVQPGESGGFGEVKDLCDLPTDCDLWRNHGAVDQARAVNLQRFACNRGIIRRYYPLRRAM